MPGPRPGDRLCPREACPPREGRQEGCHQGDQERQEGRHQECQERQEERLPGPPSGSGLLGCKALEDVRYYGTQFVRHYDCVPNERRPR